MRGVFEFTDIKGNKSQAVLTGLDRTDASLMTKLQTAAGSLQAMCNAAISQIKTLNVETQEILGQVATSNDYVSSMHKGVVNFTYAQDGEFKPYRLIIPAPELGTFEHVEGEGYRMTMAAGGALQTALRTATGISDLTFVNGNIEYWGGKSTRPENSFLKLIDANNRIQYMSVSNALNLAALVTFAGVLRGGTAFTNAAVTLAGFVTPEIESLNGTASTEEGYDSVEQRAKLTFSYVVANHKKYMHLTIPAMMSSKFVDGGQDSLVMTAVGNLIAAALTTVYGSAVRDLKFVRGKRDAVQLQQ